MKGWSHFLYLAIDLASLVPTLLLSFYSHDKFHKKLRYYAPAIVITGVLFVAWDIHFTKMGIWGFNPDYVLGYYWFNLPIEEVLFFVCIPFACAFSYETTSVLSRRERISPAAQRTITDVLSISFALVALLNTNRLYTFVTLGLTFIVLMILRWLVKPAYLGRFYVAFAFILLPFLLINGILTGTGLEEPVVWYNNGENLGWRIGTIPIEDAVYGMLLILTNVSIAEYFKQSFAPSRLAGSGSN